MRLIKDDVNVNEPDDAAYVFCGYCPITIRLIEAVVKRGWGQIKDLLKRLPGDFQFPSNERDILNVKERNNFILLVFVGGITYAEIAAIRYLNRTFKSKIKNKLLKIDHKFIIMTTHILNGKKLISNLRKEFNQSLSMKEYYEQLKALAGN